MAYLKTFLISVSVFLLAASAAQAAQCRKTPNVENSAQSVAANTAAGGHVSIHVDGYPTEVGKSMFRNEADFTNAFTEWSNYSGHKGPDPKTCGGGGGSLMDCVPADIVGLDHGAICDAVGPNGVCTKQTNFKPVKVAFRYLNNADTKGKWILNSAYPSQHDSCA